MENGKNDVSKVVDVHFITEEEAKVFMEEKKKESKVKTFWEKHGTKIMAAAIIIGYIKLSNKIDAVNMRSKKAFEASKNVINANCDIMDENFGKCWKNFDILKNDLNNLATHGGYQGQLGVNT